MRLPTLRLLLAGAAFCVPASAVWAAPAEGASAEIAPFLARPIDMMVDEAAALGEALEARTLVPSPEASPAERAYGLFQRGLYVEAREAALPLAEAGDGAMAALMARLHAEGLGVTRDPDVSLAWLRRAAEGGDIAARHEMAIRAIEGRGVERDEDAAMTELRALADDGRAEAAYDLAQLLFVRPLGELRDGEAESLLRQAAVASIPDAQYTLARLLIERDGMTAEATAPEALEWLVEAARAGLAEAQLELGIWLVTGRAGQRDLGSAFGWIERAALAGVPLAKQRLARMHWQGLGTPGDRIAAARWHALARADGIGDAELDAMLAGLTPGELDEAMQGLPRGYRLVAPKPEAARARIERRPAKRAPSVLPGVGIHLGPVAANETASATEQALDR